MFYVETNGALVNLLNENLMLSNNSILFNLQYTYGFHLHKGAKSPEPEVSSNS